VCGVGSEKSLSRSNTVKVIEPSFLWERNVLCNSKKNCRRGFLSDFFSFGGFFFWNERQTNQNNKLNSQICFFCSIVRVVRNRKNKISCFFCLDLSSTTISTSDFKWLEATGMFFDGAQLGGNNIDSPLECGNSGFLHAEPQHVKSLKISIFFNKNCSHFPRRENISSILARNEEAHSRSQDGTSLFTY
jgi:hypothetical protein